MHTIIIHTYTLHKYKYINTLAYTIFSLAGYLFGGPVDLRHILKMQMQVLSAIMQFHRGIWVYRHVCL